MRLKRSAGYSNAWLGLHRDSGLGNALNLQKRWGVMLDLRTIFDTQQVACRITDWLLTNDVDAFSVVDLKHDDECETPASGRGERKPSLVVALLKALLAFVVVLLTWAVRKLRDKSASLRGKFRNAASTITSLIRPPPFMSSTRFLTAVLSIAMLFATACSNDNEPDDVTTPPVVETPVEPVVKVNKELYFSQKDATQIEFDTLYKYLAMDNIDTIFMIPQGGFWGPNDLGYHYFELARSNVLEPRTNLSPRIRGKGSFETYIGHPTQALEDSLWFVSKGWEVNGWLPNQNTK